MIGSKDFLLGGTPRIDKDPYVIVYLLPVFISKFIGSIKQQYSRKNLDNDHIDW